MLSKSEYKSALSCPKKLWLSRHMPQVRSALSESAQRRMKMGSEVGKLARGYFDGGIEVPVYRLSNEEAAEMTAALMSDGASVLYEATFIFGKLIARIDILKREADGWHIVEVKATSKYKRPDHLPDVAFQAHVLLGCGYSLNGASLMHLSKDYVWEGGQWDLQRLFAVEDITEDVIKAEPKVADIAASFVSLVAEEAYPPVGGLAPYFDPVIQSACKGCEFSEHCKPRVPKDHVYYLGLHHAKLKKLLADGIYRIEDVPLDFNMSAAEKLRFDAFKRAGAVVSPNLADRLGAIEYPAHLIDFETLRPDLPLFPGHRPFILLPFQWSCHTLSERPNESITDDSHGHDEFLHQSQTDPREAFVQSLLVKIEGGGSVLHYHGFEKNVISELVADGVRGAADLEARFHRFIDLREMLEDCYADPAFLGRTSIKNVLPVLAPSLSYSGLNIQNGDQAQIEYSRMLGGELDDEQCQRLSRDLLRYCKLDTWAMVEVLRALYAAA